MQDELLMRDWAALHEDFVAGLQNVSEAPEVIEPAYRPRSSDPSSRLSPAARASLRGFAASVATALLWMTLMALAIPASEAATVHASLALA